MMINKSFPQFLMFIRLLSVSGRNYLYVDRNRSWSEAIEFCRQEEAFLSTLNQEVVGSALQTCLPGNSTDLWTNTYSIATPYLLIHGRFYENC